MRRSYTSTVFLLPNPAIPTHPIHTNQFKLMHQSPNYPIQSGPKSYGHHFSKPGLQFPWHYMSPWSLATSPTTASAAPWRFCAIQSLSRSGVSFLRSLTGFSNQVNLFQKTMSLSKKQLKNIWECAKHVRIFNMFVYVGNFKKKHHQSGCTWLK